jgi:hypothetical protein
MNKFRQFELKNRALMVKPYGNEKFVWTIQKFVAQKRESQEGWGDVSRVSRVSKAREGWGRSQ